MSGSLVSQPPRSDPRTLGSCATRSLAASMPSSTFKSVKRASASSGSDKPPYTAARGAGAPCPSGIEALKAAVAAEWPMTGLLDMVKKADLQLGFTDRLRSATAYEALDRAVLRPRLLLCLNGLGTSAGLKRMASVQHGASYL